ncbi:TRAP transporter substrate-binding protein DctP [Salinisphaera sp. T31B1]|uniref:TRAP transporter substrate-binding protein n=1 Tax=Salinisphaera sp. T31B1 TaxID=727963 RepID=UPI003341DEBB
MLKYSLCKNLAAATLCLLVGLACLPAQARTLMFADSFPLSHTLSTDGTVWWMDRVETLTDGDLSFRHFPAEQLAKAGEILQKIEDGVIQAGYVGTGYVSDELPLNGALMLPGEVRDTVEASRAYWQLLKSDTPLRQEFLDNGVVPVYAVMLPPYQLVLKRGPVASLADLKGLKLRSTGSLNLVVQAVGANPVSMAAPDAYLAIQRGTLDGTVLPVTSIAPYKVNEVTKSLSTNGRFGSFGITVVMDKKVYDGLSADEKKAVDQAGDETVAHLADVVENEVQTDLAEFRDQGMAIYEIPEAMQQALEPKYAEAQQAWVKRMADRGLDGQAVIDAYESELEHVRAAD